MTLNIALIVEEEAETKPNIEQVRLAGQQERDLTKWCDTKGLISQIRSVGVQIRWGRRLKITVGVGSVLLSHNSSPILRLETGVEVDFVLPSHKGAPNKLYRTLTKDYSQSRNF